MRIGIVFLALFALAAAHVTSKYHVGDQELLKKQQHVIYLLENIVGELPHEEYYHIGHDFDLEHHYEHFENPSVVKYYHGLYQAGQVQPKGTPFSYSVSQLRKEVALLTRIFLGAKDYDTFFKITCWARVHVNQDQFVTALSSAVIQRHDMHGVILPPVYEVYPHYFFDTRIIQKVHDFVHKYGYQHEEVYHIYNNYTSYLPFGENQIAYFTEDIGLAAYYSYVNLASYFLPHEEHTEGVKIGHGAHFYYIHQQLLARYNLERLAQGLEPIRELDYYYEHIETPFKPHMRYINGVELPGRDEHHYITQHHHNYELVKLVRLLEKRIVDAIHSGYVITPQGTFLSLYRPEGLNILGEIIEATGHSINPRYYGAFLGVAKQLLGNTPEFNNIYEYFPSALELGYTTVRDPIFYQLLNKIVELFHYYQEALPAYHYNDVIVPGVNIEKVEFEPLITYFSDYEVHLDNAVPQPVDKHLEHQTYPHIKAHMKRLDHKQYEYKVHVNVEKPIIGGVVRVYMGPKYNYDGQTIDINVHRHYFFEVDQFKYDFTEGHNVITRNSHEFTGHSHDWPSVYDLKQHVEGAFKGQKPYYTHRPEHIYGFPARLHLPKGTVGGFPVQFFIIITAGEHHQTESYGPVVEENWMTYQPHHYQVVAEEDYEHFVKNPLDKVTGGYQTVEVVPHFEGQVITEGNWHWGYLYKKYPGSYYYPHWQQTHYVHPYQTGKYYHHGEYKYPTHYTEKYQEHHYQKYPETKEYKSKTPYAYRQTKEYPEGGKYYETTYKQGSYYAKETPELTHEATYPYPVHHQYTYGKGHDEYLHEYYDQKYIGDVIGGKLSLDNKPLGYPLDRQLSHSAFYARNIYVHDALIFHEEEYFPEY